MRAAETRRALVLRARALVGFVLLSAWVVPAGAEEPASADEPPIDQEEGMPPPGYVPGHRSSEGIGLSPHVPGQRTILPGAIAPVFGAPLRPNEGGKFDFHGYVQAGARAGFNTRKNPSDGQSSAVWHGDPIVPRGNVFENTNNVPYTWAELRFSYAIPQVTANVSLGAWSLSETMQAAGSFMPNAQLWVRDAFLTYVPKGLDPIKLTWNVGVFEDRYGSMAEYSTGQYGAPLIATIAGVGETLIAGVPLGGGFELQLEHGIKMNLDRPPKDAPTGPTNNWQKPWEGQTFVNHAHVALDYKGRFKPALHYISSFARDDQGDDVKLGKLAPCLSDFDYRRGAIAPGNGLCPALDHADGSLQILAADLRLSMRRFGYLYAGVSHTQVEHIRSVAGVVQILNAGGGRDLLDRYFGRNNDRGEGELFLLGAEYNVSLGELLRYPGEFWGEGPDLRLSVFGMYARITSEDPARDGEQKYKFGAEATYTPLAWLGLSGRVDRAVPYVTEPKAPLYPDQNDNAFSVLTAKAIFRSDWKAREALTLQYSKFFYRSDFHLVTLNSGGQVSNVSDEPDQHLLALYGTLWW